jgi:flavin-dependent dehydrogenase
MYDTIVIGARVAGASTAMLLARRGHRVLVVDRAGFPSDTLSTHQVQLPGVARLKRWGLLDRVIEAGTPPARHVRFDQDVAVLDGHWPEHEGVDALYSPRRTVLDSILVDAAREAGAEVREHVAVDELVYEDGRVAGIRAGGVTERAPLVVGADGRHSLVAKSVRPASYHEQPVLTCGYYTYWAGVPLGGGELYGRCRRMVGAWPTNDGLVMTYVAAPVADFHAFRADIEGTMLRALDGCGDLGERVRSGERAERLFGTAELPNRFRVPHGPGWALVGDAGLIVDPITGIGISDAFRDAELLADAVDAGLTGREDLDTALAGYRAARDTAALPMYELTTDIAAFTPLRPEQRALLDALASGPQAQVDRFLGVLGGAIPPQQYFAPRNLMRILGVRRMARTMWAMRRSRQSPGPAGTAIAPSRGASAPGSSANADSVASPQGATGPQAASAAAAWTPAAMPSEPSKLEAT